MDRASVAGLPRSRWRRRLSTPTLPAISRVRSRSRSRSSSASPGQHAFVPNKLRFETGKLYKLVLNNPSNDPHYFTSHAFTQLIYTRKVQVVQERDGKPTTLAEFKGAIREIEVYPGPDGGMVVRAGGDRTRHRPALRHRRQATARRHADHGMVGEIVIE